MARPTSSTSGPNTMSASSGDSAEKSISATTWSRSFPSFSAASRANSLRPCQPASAALKSPPCAEAPGPVRGAPPAEPGRQQRARAPRQRAVRVRRFGVIGWPPAVYTHWLRHSARQRTNAPGRLRFRGDLPASRRVPPVPVGVLLLGGARAGQGFVFAARLPSPSRWLKVSLGARRCGPSARTRLAYEDLVCEDSFMLPPFIIEQIRQREEEKRRDDRPVLELPLDDL